MSKVDSIKNILLQSDNGLCIAIRGTWGIGKTYLWKQIQEDIEKSTKQRVVYISLFGKEHYSQVLEEIVLQLFRNHNEIAKKASKVISKTINIISSGQITIEAESLFSVLQKKDFNNIIVCFDDIERKSDELKMKYFMGLISQLKDLRDCKVVVILNDEKLQDNKQAVSNKSNSRGIDNDENSDCSDYSLYKDKCIDYEFKIESALEIAEHIIKNIIFLKDKDKNFLEKLILKIFKEHFDNNLRLLLRAIEDVQYFYEHCGFDALESKYEEALFKQAIEMVYEDILLIGIEEKAKNGTPCLEYYKNNRYLEEEHKKIIKQFLQKVLLNSIGKLLLILPNEYLFSNMNDADFIQKVEEYINKIKDFQANNASWMDFSFYDNIFKQYTNITGKKLEKEKTIREQYIEQYVAEKYHNSQILKMPTIASDIDKIIVGDNELQKYYEQVEQEIMNKKPKLRLHEWIANNGNIINSFLSPTIEGYNNFNIDDIVEEFNKNKEFYEEFFNNYTTVINAEILPENNLFKAYKEFLEQDKNKNKKQLIIEFLRNNDKAKLGKLFFDE